MVMANYSDISKYNTHMYIYNGDWKGSYFSLYKKYNKVWFSHNKNEGFFVNKLRASVVGFIYI